MPVNTAALKTFAPAMRRELLEAVGRKLDLLLHSQTPDTLSTYARQIAELREQEAENREQLLERVAYTWFNRLCALRYLDAKGWHPFGCKVLMPAAEGETQPELLKLIRAGSLPAELKPHTNEARLHGLLDGQIPPAIAGADPQGEVYRELVLASCRSYHQLLPDLFEGLDDASELLLPDDLLSESSIAGGFRSAISDEDCQDVEIIGWLYQFYISEKKDQVIGKVVKSEDIPAATQLFTPNWIVKYMVQNSLGATWLATYPDSPLKGQMEFYIEPAEQTPEVQAQLAAITPESLDPEALTLIDPACGSGHILVEAYDLLKAIYLDRGYRQRDIPELILTKNLYGLDICPRAAQLTAFSLLMKGREDNRRLLERGTQLNVMALQDSTDINVERLSASVDLAATGVSRADVRMLVALFTHATTFGSLIQVPTLLAEKLPALSLLAEQSCRDLLTAGNLKLLGILARQATILARRYDAVVANPPYMGSMYFNGELKANLATQYRTADSDIYPAFIELALRLALPEGRISLVTLQNWLFSSGTTALRTRLLTQHAIHNIVQIGFNSFPSMNSKHSMAACFTLAPSAKKANAIRFANLNNGPESADKGALFRQVLSTGLFIDTPQEEFHEMPEMILAYTLSSRLRRAIARDRKLGELAPPRRGLATGDNPRFIRAWHEVNLDSIGFDMSRLKFMSSGKKWVPYNMGGTLRKWYGNNTFVLAWEHDGHEIRNLRSDTGRLRSRPQNLDAYFMPSVTWKEIGHEFCGRLGIFGSICDQTSDFLVADNKQILDILGYLNSTLVSHLLSALNPTLHFNVGTLRMLPVPLGLGASGIGEFASRAVQLAKEEWDQRECSWDFVRHPVLVGCAADPIRNMEAAVLRAVSDSRSRLECILETEVSVNRSAVKALDVEDEIDCRPILKTLGIEVDNAPGLLRQFLSYATGCMMGRYSLDHPGLILADSRASQATQLTAYEEQVGKPLSEVQFKPDPDGILPVLDGEWFEDDIVARAREFLAVTFPESSVAENLRFIEESLGKDIRKYFCSEFYKDHLQTYKKRPIYWLVQSPAGPSRGGFACLIYLHRYTKDTLNQVLNNYFRPYLQKLEARLAQLGLDQLNDDLPARERTAARKEAEKITKVLKECQAWEQDALLPLAQQRIELDLDDGVKVNYLKLQDVLAPIPGLAAKED